MSQAKLRIQLLGPPQITAGGQPLALSRRGLRSLLFYLAAQNEPQTRGQLGLLFWDNLPEAKVRKNLREMLSRLRNELPAADLLRAEPEYVWLDQELVDSDLREFLTLYDQAARHIVQIPSLSPLPESVRDLTLRALSLWRGKRFSPGVDLSGAPDLESWAAALENQLNSSRRNLLERMAVHENLLGRTDSAAGYLRDALEIDPLDDALLLRLLTVLERGGQIAKASAACRGAREEYTRHGIPFPPNLEAVCERLRQSEGQSRLGQNGPVPRRSLQLPLVGRASELEALRLAFQRRLPTAILGEAGSGKSRLLQEFAATVASAARVFHAAANPMGGNMPFQPIIDILRAGMSAEEWQKIPNAWTTVLALLLPELPSILPDIRLPANLSSLNQALLFEALHQVLRAMAVQQRLVILLDNAQWCDETTLSAFNYFYEKGLLRENVFLVVAAREEEQPPGLKHLLQNVRENDPNLLLHLRAMNLDEVREIVQMVFPSGPTEELATRLLRDMGGNPFYLLETLRAMLEYSSDSLSAVLAESIPLAGSVHHLVSERLQRLSPDAQSALALAAIAGNPFSLNLLESAGRYDAEQMMLLVEEITAAHLIRPAVSEEENRDAPGRSLSPSDFAGSNLYQFVHERVRDILLMEMSPARRRFFHLRVAEALQRQELALPEALAAVLADHYQQAGDMLPAFHFWIKAAAYARRLYSLSEQQRAYEQAEKILLQNDTAFQDQDIVDLYVGWRDLGCIRADGETTRRSGETLLRQGRRRENPMLACAGLMGLSAAANIAEQGDQALRYLAEARPFLEEKGSLQEWLDYHYQRAIGLVYGGRITEAITELQRALERIANDPGGPTITETRAHCYSQLAEAVLFSGWPEKALQNAENALADSRAVMSHGSATRAMARLGITLCYLGRHTIAHERNEMALNMAFPMQNWRLIGKVYYNMARQSFMLGQLDESWSQAGKALEAGMRTGAASILCEAYRAQADVLTILGAVDEAIPLYLQAVQAGEISHAGLEALYMLGLALIETGAVEEGMQAIERSIAKCQESGIGLIQLHALWAKSTAWLRMRKSQEAVRLAEDVAVEAAQRNLPYLRGLVYIPLAQNALMEGRRDEARQKALALIQIARASQYRLMEIKGCVLALQADDRLSDVRSRLRDLLAFVQENAQDAALRPHVERARPGYTLFLA